MKILHFIFCLFFLISCKDKTTKKIASNASDSIPDSTFAYNIDSLFNIDTMSSENMVDLMKVYDMLFDNIYNNLDYHIFSDTVIFKTQKATYAVSDNVSKQENWSKIKIKLENTDFIVNYYLENNIELANPDLCNNYILRNHIYWYVISLDKNKHISMISDITPIYEVPPVE